MTREIALHCMKAYSERYGEVCEECPIYGETGEDHCFNDALDFVIEALEQEPCEDAVNREDVLNEIWHWASYTTGDLLKAIKNLPSVHPKQKTGHWTRELIRNEYGGCIGGKRICSVCNKDNKHDVYMDYCPNCGAKMEG